MRTQETEEPESQPLKSLPVGCVCFTERIYRVTFNSLTRKKSNKKAIVTHKGPGGRERELQ